MDIRFVLPEEVEQLKRNVQTAFPSKTPDALLQSMESELHHPDEGRYLGCFDDDGTLVGSILMMDFTLNVRGLMMPMGAAAYISTHFLHKKEHVARSLLRVLMGYYVKLGAPIGCLHPFNPAFYRKMGYGYGNESYFYAPKASEIQAYRGKANLTFAGKADEEELLAYYRAYAERTNGATLHHFMDPHRIFDMPYVVICRKAGRIKGYLTFEFVAVEHYVDAYHDLCVREMIWDDVDTLHEFMTFFASQVDQIERVRIVSPDPYLHLHFKNPDSGENRVHDGCIQETGRKTMGYMTRIFDIASYFAIQSHCEAPMHRSFAFALDVADDFLPHNHGTFLFHAEGNSLRRVTEGTPDVRLALGIDALSSLCTGALPLEELLRHGKAQLSDGAFLRDLQSALGWSQKPQNYTYF